jgi:hypothetical protein
VSEPSPRSSCPTCGDDAAPGARFCASCGSPLEEGVATAVIPPPPHVTGQVPVAVVTSEPRLFGVVPPGALLAAALLVLGASVVAFATGRWALGLVLLGLALLGLAGVVEAARRRPGTMPGRRISAAWGRVSGRVGAAAASYVARSSAAREVRAYRYDSLQLAARRKELLAALGEAVYGDDEGAASNARRELRALDAEVARREQETAAAVARAEERVRHARIAVQATEMVQVPEPYPPPDEGTPPLPEPVPEQSPPLIPEPYPPPDEGTPPSEPQVPEPSPPGERAS